MNKIYNQIGVSCYISTKNLNYLEVARMEGVKNLFVSLHIAEEIDENFKQKVQKFFSRIYKFHFEEIICDISKIGIKNLGKNWIEFLKKLKITFLRTDYGFTNLEIISLAKHFRIAINASQVNEFFLKILKRKNLIQKIIAFHNFYPLPGTGISSKDLFFYDNLLRKYGVNKIFSFAPGEKKLRNNTLMERLPTLEKHRYISTQKSILELLNKFKHDIVFIGDPDFPSMIFLKKETILKIKISNQFLRKNEYNVRWSNNFIRIKNTRFMSHSESGKSSLKYKKIKPKNNEGIKNGDIVICNNLSKRYEGEIMICIKDLPKAKSMYFNVIGNQTLTKSEKEIIKNSQKILIK